VAGQHVRSFSSPDELIDLGVVRAALVTVGGLTVSHDVHQPGWRWSTHIKPVVGTESCQVRHVGVILKGRMHVVLDDGQEFEAGPLDLFDIPAGHDAWAVGDEPLETVAWTGAKTWLAPLESLTERILVTLLFTDVVDSTSTAQRLGDRAWSDVVAGHEARIRDILGHYRGREIKMTGDGVLAVFDGPARAIRCATALRSAATDFHLAIRAAVHTGEVELVEKDLRGVAVHEASRMLGLAGPGEVLVSATTATLARDAGLMFEDRGEHELRGLDGTRRLFAVL
jgi:class 3 adenylate cyclase